jgi:hypothetical protein
MPSSRPYWLTPGLDVALTCVHDGTQAMVSFGHADVVVTSKHSRVVATQIVFAIAHVAKWQGQSGTGKG